MILRREGGRSQRRKIIYKFCQKSTVFDPKSTWFVQSLPKSGITYNIPLMKLRWLLAERFSCPKKKSFHKMDARFMNHSMQKNNCDFWRRKECNISCNPLLAVNESYFLFDPDKYHLWNMFGDIFDTLSTWAWVPEFEITWSLANQLVMSPMLHDPPLLHNIYLLRVLDRRKTVGDRDGGPALLGLVQRLLDHLEVIDNENWTSTCPAPPSRSRRPVLT